MRTHGEIDSKLAAKLAILKEQPARDPQIATKRREAFLAEAQEMSELIPAAVSAGEEGRHIRWMHALQNFIETKRKEHSPMFGALGTLVLIFSLVLGGGGATVAAAQGSLPDQALYPIKTWSENIRFRLTENEQTRLQLALAFSNRRFEEMEAMLLAGWVPNEAVQTRLRAEIDLALRLAAQQADPEAVRTLEQIRTQLQLHERTLLQMGPQANQQVQAVMDQTRSMLQERIRVCDEGILEPVQLRTRLQKQDNQPDDEKPSGSGLPPVDTGSGNPWTTGTPTPGSGYGPGPGDGSDDGAQGENNPWTEDAPTPGSGYGPGPGDGSEDPQGIGENPWTVESPSPGGSEGPGPQPEQPAPGDGSGGNDQGGGTDSGGEGDPDSGAGEPGGGGETGPGGGGNGGH